MPSEIAVIVGVGQGLSAALARGCAERGMSVVLAARNIEKLSALASETDARLIACDATDRRQVDALFHVVGAMGAPVLVVYNASYRNRGPFVALDAGEVARTLEVTALGGFHVGQAAARMMLPLGRGSIFFTGASASVKGYAQSAPFAMGKFALRGLAQSMARELSPQGIHVAHFVIDGQIRNPGVTAPLEKPDSMLDPHGCLTGGLAPREPPATRGAVLVPAIRKVSTWHWGCQPMTNMVAV